MTNQKAIDGEGVHIGDCYVWSEIFYLDSPTDYRECITKAVSQQSRAIDGEFVTLDTELNLFGVLLAIARPIGHFLS